MAIQYVGGNYSSDLGFKLQTLYLTGGISSYVAVGDVVVVFVAASYSSDISGSITCSDDNVNTWVKAHYAYGNAAYKANLAVFYSKIVNVAPYVKINGVPTSSTYGNGLSIQVWRGVDNTVLDVAKVVGTTTYSSVIASRTITPVTSGAVILYGGANAQTASGSAVTFANSAYTVSGNDDGTTSDACAAIGSYTSWTSGAYTTPASTGGSTSASCSSVSIALALRPLTIFTLTPGLYTNSNNLYVPAVFEDFQLSPTLHTNNVSLYVPTLSTGSVTLTPSLYTNSSSLYVASLEQLDPEYVKLNASSYISTNNTDVTTARLIPPSGKTTSSFQAGSISDDTNPINSINLDENKYTEIEWCFKVTNLSQIDDEFEFRVTNNGSVLDTYTQIPSIIVNTFITLELTAPIINNISSLYTFSTTKGAVTLTPAVYTNTPQIAVPSLTPGIVNLIPNLHTNASVVYTPSISTITRLTASYIISGSSLYQPSVAPGSINVTTPLYTNTNLIYTPSLSVGVINLLPTLFLNTNYTFVPTVIDEKLLTPQLLNNNSTLFVPTISSGAVSLSVPQITSSTVLFEPTVIIDQFISAPFITSTSVQYNPTVGIGANTLSAQLHTNISNLYTPSVTVGLVILTVPLLTNVTTIYNPVLTDEESLSVSFISNVSSIYTPQLICGAVSISAPKLDSISYLYTPQIIESRIVTVPYFVNSNELYTFNITTGSVSLNISFIASENNLWQPVCIPGFALTSIPLLINSNSLFNPIVSILFKLYPNTLNNVSSLYTPITVYSSYTISMPLIGVGDYTFYTPFAGEYHLEDIVINQIIYLVNTSGGNVKIYLKSTTNYINIGPNIEIETVLNTQPSIITINAVKVKVKNRPSILLVNVN